MPEFSYEAEPDGYGLTKVTIFEDGGIAAVLHTEHDPEEVVREHIETRIKELEAEIEGLISRSDRLDPADCTDTKICHIIVRDRQCPAGWWALR